MILFLLKGANEAILEGKKKGKSVNDAHAITK